MIRGVVKSYGPTHAAIENYSFSSPFGREVLAELGGVVKLELAELRVPFDLVPPASARRLLGRQPAYPRKKKAKRRGKGKLVEPAPAALVLEPERPKIDPKVWAHQKLYAAGAPHHWTEAELDAFLVANWKLADFGAALIIEPEAA